MATHHRQYLGLVAKLSHLITDEIMASKWPMLSYMTAGIPGQQTCLNVWNDRPEH